MRYFTAIAFQLCFTIHHYEGPRNQMQLKLNGTHQFLIYADDVYLLGDNINTIKKNISASNQVEIDINTKKTKHKVSVMNTADKETE
jgi:hypothetical protein